MTIRQRLRSCPAPGRTAAWRQPAGAVLLLLLLGLLLVPMAAAPLRAAPRLQLLGTAVADHDLWPQVQVLDEGPQVLSAAQALARRAEFRPPRGPHANLGMRAEAVWLQVSLEVAAGDSGRWLLDIDYPALDRVEVYVVEPGGASPTLRAVLGDQVPQPAGQLATRSLVAALALTPGQPQDLLLRVRSSGTLIVPLRLMRADHFSKREAGVQLIQGLCVGLGLCLFCYTLAQWLSLREASFLLYGLSVAASTLFNFSYFGLARQHLWPDQPWLVAHGAALSMLLLIASGQLFLERFLQMSELRPALGRAMRATAVIALALALAFVAGLAGYRLVHVANTLLGLAGIALALPVAVARARSGDRSARYVVIGWVGLAVGIAVSIGLAHGWIGNSRLAQHALQVAGMFEMLMWQLVLGERIGQLRRAAEHSLRERELLHSLAHTDALTGLPNRRGLQQLLQDALPAAGPQRLQAVYLLDLDGFKTVNDRLGHDGGDLLLQQVAQRLRQQLRTRDVLARLGGDEFVALVVDLPSDAAALALADKLLQSVDQPFDIGGQACRVGLTIGYALAPLDGRDVAGLLKRADAAMYAGKQDGKHCVRRGGGHAAPLAAAA